MMYHCENIFIAPIKNIIYDLSDSNVDYILCTSEPSVAGIMEKDNILILHFLDIVDDHSMRFNDDDAERIISFISRPQANKDLFVCCDSGQSRSPAIAAAINLAICGNDNYIWDNNEYNPNPYIFKKMCAKLGVILCNEELTKRIK